MLFSKAAEHSTYMTGSSNIVYQVLEIVTQHKHKGVKEGSTFPKSTVHLA
jgi:hypothetical protein